KPFIQDTLAQHPRLQCTTEAREDGGDMSKKRSNVSLAVAAKTLGNSAADEEFVRRGAASGKTSKRHDVKRRMTVYLPDDLALALERRAVDERATVSSMVEQAVRTLLKH